MVVGTLLQILGVLFALGTPIGLWYRYWWGSKSHIKVRQLNIFQSTNWRDTTTEGESTASVRFIFIASNGGWRDGFIGDVRPVSIKFDNGRTITDINSVLKKSKYERSLTESTIEKLDMDRMYNLERRQVKSRDDLIFYYVLHLLTDSEFTEIARSATSATFRFEGTFEDHSRKYTREFSAEMELGDQLAKILSSTD